MQDFPHSTSIFSSAEVEQDKLLLDSEKVFLKGREEDNRPLGEKVEGGFKFVNGLGACSRRRFAVTQKGYLALVPPLTEAGDQVCAVLGAEVPFLF